MNEELIIDENYEGIIDEGYRYVYRGSINFEFNIKFSLGKWLYIDGSIKAGKGIEAGGGIEAVFIVSFGHKGLTLMFMAGLKYNIWRWGSMLKIGCQKHLVDDWKNFDDSEIRSMDTGALEWWNQHKSWILNLLPDEKEIKDEA